MSLKQENQLSLLQSLLNTENISAPNSEALTATNITRLYELCKLPFNCFITGEFRKPKRGEYYLNLYIDSEESDALRFSLNYCSQNVRGKFVIVEKVVNKARAQNKFDLLNCLDKQGGRALYKNRQIKLFASFVDKNLNIPVVENNTWLLVPVTDLVNVENIAEGNYLQQMDSIQSYHRKWKQNSTVL